jgi:chromosome segregation ATPase
MPTAGKVLVVLVLLVVPVWIVLVSGVAELNKSGGEQVATLKSRVDQLDAELSKTEKALVDMKDEIALHQRAMAEQLAVIRSRQADLQKARSETMEIASRAKLQVDSMQEAAKRAEATRDLRKSEVAHEKEAMAATEAEVEKLKQDHAELVDQLDKLRNQFKTTVDSNRQMVGRLKSARAS